MKIKNKVLLIFLIFTFFLIFSYIFFSKVFLEKYYILRHTQNIKHISQSILDNATNLEDLKNSIDSYNNIKNINIVILDNNFEVIKNLEDEKEIFYTVIKLAIEKNIEKIGTKNQIIFKIDIKKDVNEKKIFCANKFKNYYLVLVDSISDIKESVSIANEFFVLFSLILGIIYFFIIYILSDKITKPILNINNITEKMTNLNFDEKIEVKSRDEIGELSKNINFLFDELFKNINKLNQDINLKKELIRNISHELKTPIGIIKGYTEALKFKVVEDEKQIQDYYNIIIDESDRMDRLIKELLNYQALESNILKLNYVNFNLREFLEKIIYKFDIIFKEKDIKLYIECDEDLDIIADENLLENAINNFITNAIRYVELERIIKISAKSLDEYIKIDVFNTGYNIDEKDIEKIWEVFYKVDKARSKRDNNGIGLSFVKSIASLHNGKVEVENTKDGVIFSIYIKKFT